MRTKRLFSLFLLTLVVFNTIGYVKQIQLVRGSSALQFGLQFGGMMNYVMKEGDSTKVFPLESEQTAGSYNFLIHTMRLEEKKEKSATTLSMTTVMPIAGDRMPPLITRLSPRRCI